LRIVVACEINDHVLVHGFRVVLRSRWPMLSWNLVSSLDAFPDLLLDFARSDTLGRLLGHVCRHQSPSFEMVGGSGNAIRGDLVIFPLALVLPPATSGSLVVVVMRPRPPIVVMMLRHGES
jgi:hypothetical protein